MSTNLTNEYFENYIINFRKTPERFASFLDINELKLYGVNNNDFWKNYIININKVNSPEFLEENGLHKYLARIFFIENASGKFYLLEKLPVNKVEINEVEVDKIASELTELGVEVDKSSATIVDNYTNKIKFLKYKILKDK